MSRPVILVVDDDETLLGVLRDIIELDRDALIHEAVDGETALTLVDEVRPDLILVDLLLPGIGGIEFCQRVRQNPHLVDVPIVALSASGPEAVLRERALAAGCVEFVAKPFDLDHLQNVISRYLSAANRAEDERSGA